MTTFYPAKSYGRHVRSKKDLSPQACIKRLERCREVWTQILDKALGLADGREVGRCENELARIERAIAYNQSLLPMPQGVD